MKKVVIVTGGSQGIGKSIAAEFAKTDAQVIIYARTESDVKKSALDVQSYGGTCEGFALDVSDNNSVKKNVDYVAKKYGHIDVLVNCAGIQGSIGLFESNDLALWKKTIDINLLGTVNMTYSVLPYMKKQNSGTIVNFAGGGIGSSKVQPNFSAYITSKFAVYGFTEAVALELKQYGITINSISPGAVNTRLLDEVLSAGEVAGKERIESSKKQKETGGTSPEKASKLIVFLSSDSARNITGKMLSAVWDDVSKFDLKKERLSGSLYTLRRIDDELFTEKK